MLLEFESLRLRHFCFSKENLKESPKNLKESPIEARPRSQAGFLLFSRLTLSTGISLNQIGYRITNCIMDSGTRNDLGSYTVKSLFDSSSNVLVDFWGYTVWIFVIHRHVQNRYMYSGPPVKDQKGVKKSLGQGSRNEALFIHAARVYLSR